MLGTPSLLRCLAQMSVMALSFSLPVVATADQPTVPGTPTVSTSGQNVTLNWTPSQDDNAVAGYNVYLNDTYLRTVFNTRFSGSLDTSTDNTFYVTAFDEPLAGEQRAYSESSGRVIIPRLNSDNPITPVGPITSDQPDLEAPSVPEALELVSTSNTSVIFRWAASSDNVGVVGYNIYRQGNYVSTVFGTRYSDTEPLADVAAEYSVVAFDEARNYTSQSAALSISGSGDTPTGTPPVDEPEIPEVPRPPVDEPEIPEVPRPPVDEPETPEVPRPPVDEPQTPEVPRPPVDEPETPEVPEPPAPQPSADFEFSSSGDQDDGRFQLFNFEVAAGELVEAVVTWDDPNADVRVFLRDETSTRVDFDLLGEGSAMVSALAEASGRWAVAVQVDSARIVNYDVRVNTTTVAAPPPPELPEIPRPPVDEPEIPEVPRPPVDEPESPEVPRPPVNEPEVLRPPLDEPEIPEVPRPPVDEPEIPEVPEPPAPQPRADFEFSSSGDQDDGRFQLFNFRVAAGERVEAVVTWDDPNADVSVFLRVETSTRVDFDLLGEGSAMVSALAEASGRWSVAVQVDSARVVNYDVRVNLSTSGADDFGEMVPEFDASNRFPSPDPNDPFGSLLEIDPEEPVPGGPPTTPKNLRIDLVANDWAEFNWAPSNDDVGVVAYNIYRSDDVTYVVSPELTDPNAGSQAEIDKYWSTTSFIDCNFTRFDTRVHNCRANQPIPGETYTYQVSAVDADGQESPLSRPLSITYHLPMNAPVPIFDDFYKMPDDLFAQSNDLSETRFFLDEFNLAFSDEFEGASLDLTKWQTGLTWGDAVIINGEQQYFVPTQDDPEFGYDPFSFDGETLTISAIPTPDELKENLPPACSEIDPTGNERCLFLSGALSSHDRFGFLYGYVEGRMKVGATPGMLSSFYLYHRYTGSGVNLHAPEIDIVEYLGENPFGAEDAFQTYHFDDVTTGLTRSSPTMSFSNPDGELYSDEFHTYGVLWEPQLVIWYIDGKEVKRLTGPMVSRQPMNIVNYLVTGSVWAPTPDASDPSIFPLEYQVDYIRVYQRDPYTGTATFGTP